MSSPVSSSLTRDELKAQILNDLASGLTPAAIADAIANAVFGPPPAPTGEPPRDETGDSIDPTTGQLTSAAKEARLQADRDKIAADQAADDAAAAAVKTAEDAKAAADATLAADEDQFGADQKAPD